MQEKLDVDGSNPDRRLVTKSAARSEAPVLPCSAPVPFLIHHATHPFTSLHVPHAFMGRGTPYPSSRGENSAALGTVDNPAHVPTNLQESVVL